MISLTLENCKLKIKIIPSPDWDRDLAIAKSIANRAWNAEDKTWDVPETQLEEVLKRWEKHDVLFKGKDLVPLISDRRSF